jgi:uracil-DNA glycosylase family 4
MPEVKSRGRIDAPIVFVGDAPTEEDFIAGKAWSGAVGELMVDVLKRVGIDPDEILYLNAVSYGRPSKDYKFTADDIIPDSDRYLIPTIAMHPRKLVVAFGNNALCAVGVVPKPEKVLSLRMKPLTSPTLEDNGVTCPITCSVHPWSVLREPDESESFMTDLRFAYRALNEDMELIFQTQAPMVIHDIEDPDQIDDVYKHVVKIGEVAYDYETTGLNPLTDYPVTLSLCDGRIDQNKNNIVHWWASHNRLNLRFSEKMLIGFKEKWHWFFSRAGEDYDLISWNGNFDDWMSQTWLDDPDLPGSQFDAMLMKWQLNNKRPHGLKEATARYLGYPNYDEAVDIAVKEIKARRTKILRDPDDFFVVDFFGLETVKTKTGQKWPEGVDKGLAAYAMIDYDTLREYGCYDALYTLKLKRLFGEQIEKEDLIDACDLRHRIRQELLRCQQRGMLVDVETARSFSTELLAIGDACDKKIEVQLAEMGITIPNFNPNSGPQVIEVLFGKPVDVPLLLPGTLVNRDMSYKIAEERCRIVEEAIYGENFKLLREVVKAGEEFNASDAERRLRDEYRRRFSTSAAPGVKRMPMYLNGTHEPAGFTKSGLPSTGSAILQSINQQNPSDFLSLLLMQRRAVKLRGTFVEGVLKRMDENHIIRPFFNTIGTETGRISSCVRKGTKVLTNRGLRNIEDIREGDSVYGHDGKLHRCLVDAFEKPVTRFYRVVSESGKSIECTAAHRFFTPDGWKSLSELSVSSSILCYNDAQYVPCGVHSDSMVSGPSGSEFTFVDRIVAITELDVDIPWDITVESSHSYLAHGFLNHNSNPNGQNFVKSLRGMLIPRKGYRFLEWDLCLCGHTLISTNRGLLPLMYVNKGDEVIQEDGTYRKVLRNRFTGIKSVKRISVAGGAWVDATDNHRFRVIDATGDYVWKCVSELQLGDWIPQQTSTAPLHVDDDDLPLLPDVVYKHAKEHRLIFQKHPTIPFMEWVGYWTGDGGYQNNKYVGFSVCRDDVDLRDWIETQNAALFGAITHDYKNNKGAYELRIGSTVLVKWMRSLALSKDSVPSWIFQCPRDMIAGYLRGLFEADGSYKHNHVSLTLKSASLIDGVRVLLQSVGVMAELSEINGYYRLCVTKAWLPEFAKVVGALSVRKRQELNAQMTATGSNAKYRAYPVCTSLDWGSLCEAERKLLNNTRFTAGRRISYRVAKQLSSKTQEALKLTNLTKHGQDYRQIVSIEELGEVPTFDLEVEDTHTFIAQGFVSHNSQAEIRAVAAYSQDEGLIAALNSSDIHSTIAAMIFNVPVEKIGKDSAERRYAKTIVFGIIYGMSAWRLHMAIGVTLEQAEEFIEKFFAAFPKLKMWLDKQVRVAKRYPYYVYTPWGTRRSTLNMRSVDKKVISHTERIAMNMPIQGAAGELTLFYICEIMDKVRAGLHDCHLVNTTHDSCTLEVAESLMWEEPTGDKDKDGKDIMRIAGPIVDIVNEVINNVEVLPHPLNTVNFVADMELNDHWSGKPNLKKAVDPKWKESEGTGSLRWDLLKPEEHMDVDELKEFMEVEEVAMYQVT